MSDFKEQISGVVHSKYENSALYIMFIGMAMGNIIPSPTDALYFHIQTKLRNKWKDGSISAEKYWKYNTLSYYFIPFVWWAILALIVVNVKGTSKTKAKIALALIGSSAVLGVVLKQMQTDKLQLTKEEEEKVKLMREHPEVVKILNKPEYSNITPQFRNFTGEKLEKNLDELRAKNK